MLGFPEEEVVGGCFVSPRAMWDHRSQGTHVPILAPFGIVQTGRAKAKYINRELHLTASCWALFFLPEIQKESVALLIRKPQTPETQGGAGFVQAWPPWKCSSYSPVTTVAMSLCLHSFVPFLLVPGPTLSAFLSLASLIQLFQCHSLNSYSATWPLNRCSESVLRRLNTPCSTLKPVAVDLKTHC